MLAETEKVIEARRASWDLAAGDITHPAWETTQVAYIDRYWSGEAATPERHTEARLLWSEAALHARFVYRQGEPLIVNATPLTEQKTVGLWERDVCELFIAPGAGVPERYFEFEAAPTGEWLDLAIRWLPAGRETNWDFHSRMTVATHISKNSITIAMRVPWKAMERTAREGERWRVNLFRCVGAGATRGYLAWSPTYTAEPNFHVPEKFGWLEFRD